MKYEKPEMEIMMFEENQVFTLGITSAEGEQNQAPGSGTGDSWATP